MAKVGNLDANLRVSLNLSFIMAEVGNLDATLGVALNYLL